MFSASDLKKGLKIEIDDEPWVISHFDFCKPGKGQALYRCKMKNMITGNTMDKTYRSVEKIGKPDLMEKDMIYSYVDGNAFIFMDTSTYEQIEVGAEIIGDKKHFLTEDSDCKILFYNNRPIEVLIPTFVEKKIARTEPGARGDTATNVLKPAWLDDEYEIQVPLFINEGDTIKIDTRTGDYSERVNR